MTTRPVIDFTEDDALTVRASSENLVGEIKGKFHDYSDVVCRQMAEDFTLYGGYFLRIDLNTLQV